MSCECIGAGVEQGQSSAPAHVGCMLFQDDFAHVSAFRFSACTACSALVMCKQVRQRWGVGTRHQGFSTVVESSCCFKFGCALLSSIGCE